jgi:hypothetical protein
LLPPDTPQLLSRRHHFAVSSRQRHVNAHRHQSECFIYRLGRRQNPTLDQKSEINIEAIKAELARIFDKAKAK